MVVKVLSSVEPKGALLLSVGGQHCDRQQAEKQEWGWRDETELQVIRH